MDSATKTHTQRMLLVVVCCFGAIVVLALGFANGILSPRGLGIALLTVCVAVGIGVVIVTRKTAAELSETSEPLGIPINEATRKRRVLGIRVGQLAIVVLFVLLLNGLREIGRVPTLPVLVGAGINLCIIAAVVWVIVRLQKTLN